MRPPDAFADGCRFPHRPGRFLVKLLGSGKPTQVRHRQVHDGSQHAQQVGVWQTSGLPKHDFGCERWVIPRLRSVVDGEKDIALFETRASERHRSENVLALLREGFYEPRLDHRGGQDYSPMFVCISEFV